MWGKFHCRTIESIAILQDSVLLETVVYIYITGLNMRAQVETIEEGRQMECWLLGVKLGAHQASVELCRQSSWCLWNQHCHNHIAFPGCFYLTSICTPTYTVIMLTRRHVWEVYKGECWGTHTEYDLDVSHPCLSLATKTWIFPTPVYPFAPRSIHIINTCQPWQKNRHVSSNKFEKSQK